MMMVKQTAHSYAGQLWWKVVDVDTGATLFRSWREAEAWAYKARHDVSPDYYTMTLRPNEKQLLLDGMMKILSDQTAQGFSAARLKEILTRIEELEVMK